MPDDRLNDNKRLFKWQPEHNRDRCANCCHSRHVNTLVHSVQYLDCNIGGFKTQFGAICALFVRR